MKSPALAATALACLACAAQSARLQRSPVTKVLDLLGDLKTRLEADGAAEQGAYDKYACWCEDTLAAKAKEITDSKDQIESLQTSIVQLKGEVATHTAEIKQLKKDIGANLESQREATEVREKESAAYQAERTESEQCIGALEAAIGVLADAGTKGRFLETLQEAQLLSVAAGVRGLLRQPAVSRAVGEKDLQVVQHFVERPEDFVGGRTGALSAAQIANNPFGDYAPQSTQIQGILKGMYDTFTGDLEKAKVEEAKKQKGFEDLMATKKAELAALQSSLTTQTSEEATKTKAVADKKIALADTEAQLEADEAFFAQTKGGCELKAQELAQRTRLRTEELHGIGQAVAVLSSPEAQATFQNASTSFLQLSSDAGTSNAERERAYQRIRGLAAHYSNVALARLAAKVHSSSAGHFDEVIATIDNMIALLRREEQEDIKQRDWCQNKQTKNKHDMEDINHDINKAEKTLERMGGEETELKGKLSALNADINATRETIKELVQTRTMEQTAFIQAVKDDTEAIRLLGEAIGFLTKFYKSNGIPLALSQKQRQAEKRSATRPDEPWESGAYGGRKQESVGVIAILSMLKEDFEKEVKMARQADAAAQVNFEKDRQALFNTEKAQKDAKVSTQKELADLGYKITDVEEHKTTKGDDLASEQEWEQALVTDCAWVESHFDDRRTKRKAEIDGLVEAKNFLAGTDEE